IGYQRNGSGAAGGVGSGAAVIPPALCGPASSNSHTVRSLFTPPLSERGESHERTRRIGADRDHRARERTGGGGPQTPTSAITSTVSRRSFAASRHTDRTIPPLWGVAVAMVLVGAGAGPPAAGALLVVGGFPVGRVEHESRVADEAPGDAGAARPLASAATPAVGAAAGTEVLVGAD